MPDYGFGALSIGTGAQAGLQQLLKQRLLEREMALREQAERNRVDQDMSDRGLRERQLNETIRSNDLNAMIAGIDRADAQQNRVNMEAGRVADDLAIGQELPADTQEVATLMAGGRGSLLKAKPMSPQEAISGLRIGAPDQMGARSITADNRTGAYTYEGTGTQRNAAESQRRADEAGRRSEDAAGRSQRALDISERRLGLTEDRLNQRVVTVQEDDPESGGTVTVGLDPDTGEERWRSKSKGTAQQRDRAASMKRIQPVLNSISDLSERINTGQGVMAKISGAAERAKAQANLNDDVAEYNAVISGFTPMVARAVGHSGVLTEQDVQSVRDLFPKPGDSKSLRDRKIARILFVLGAQGDGGGKVYLDDEGKPKR